MHPLRRAIVLMPFSPKYRELHETLIKPACADAGIEAATVDERPFHGSIVEQIYRQIRDADVVIAELTEPNRNVYYELGYARALGKRLVLLTASEEEIPFDVRTDVHLIHRDEPLSIRAKLTAHLAAIIEQRSADVAGIAVGFPWPPLLRRAMSALDAVKRHFRASADTAAFVASFPEFVRGLGAHHARDIQINLVDEQRRVVHHDFADLAGGPAVHVGAGGDNIYDEVYRYKTGAVAWVDTIGNAPDHPRVRTNLAVFTKLGTSGLRVVVELHDELR